MHNNIQLKGSEKHSSHHSVLEGRRPINGRVMKRWHHLAPSASCLLKRVILIWQRAALQSVNVYYLYLQETENTSTEGKVLRLYVTVISVHPACGGTLPPNTPKKVSYKQLFSGDGPPFVSVEKGTSPHRNVRTNTPHRRGVFRWSPAGSVRRFLHHAS